MSLSREQQLEAALLEYVEKYGLTEAAKQALSVPDTTKLVQNYPSISSKRKTSSG